MTGCTCKGKLTKTASCPLNPCTFPDAPCCGTFQKTADVETRRYSCYDPTQRTNAKKARDNYMKSRKSRKTTRHQEN
ncbi:unnamed protein product, partial [Mesorhabditis spiculigera]